MAKTKPIGVRFPEDMVKHFKEERKVDSYQAMLNCLWAEYASKNKLWTGRISVKTGVAFEVPQGATLIDEHRAELAAITGTSAVAIQRRKWLQNKIQELNKQLK